MLSLASLASKIFGSSNDRMLKTYRPKVDAINELEAELRDLSDFDLKARTGMFRKQLADGGTLDDLLVPAFATVREAARRALGQRHFDVQLLGGMVLHSGNIAEMKTGEGKTLVATAPVYLNALAGRGVHVVTVNDYLARRDSDWMGTVYKFLGLTVGCIVHDLDDEQRRAAYACDVTYGTNNEFGFDYLRDNMKMSVVDMVQFGGRPKELAGHAYAIVDEVDSILIDEARTPLIISGPVEDRSDLYTAIDALMAKLAPSDYEVDEKQKQVAFTEVGQETIENLLKEADLLKGDGLYDIENVTVVHHINQALKAHKLFQRDRDYIVKDSEVVIIDEFTGRMMSGRRYSEGLHQALEAKEHATIQPENQTLASITFQNYFRLYDKLAGMTGTAVTEADEFLDIYKLDVIEIPTNVPVGRADLDDEVYRTGKEKWEAIIRDIEGAQKRHQPVLVGTVSIEKSETLSELLKERGVKHQVLNARYHEQEALIIAQAGVPGGVTIATNMAGRGTDIQLGGNAEFRISEWMAKELAEGRGTGIDWVDAKIAEDLKAYIKAFNDRDGELGAWDPSDRARAFTKKLPQLVKVFVMDAEPTKDLSPEEREKIEKVVQRFLGKLGETLKTIVAEVERDREIVLAASETIEIEPAKGNRPAKTITFPGGLYVMGTERHESRRIDNQLRGRSGRQGDPGRTKFYLSLEDDLMRIFAADRIDGMLKKLGLEEGEAITHRWINKALENAQKKVEARNFDSRKYVLKYDDTMNDQRKVVFEQRIDIMGAEDVSDTVDAMRHQVLEELVSTHIPENAYAEQWDAEGLHARVQEVFGLDMPIAQWADEEGIADQEILERLTTAVDEKFNKLAEEVGTGILANYEQAKSMVAFIRSEPELQSLVDAGPSDESFERLGHALINSNREEIRIQGPSRAEAEAQVGSIGYSFMREYVEAKGLVDAIDTAPSRSPADVGRLRVRDIEKSVLLRTLDTLWREHLVVLEHLRTVINFRAYGQRDPVNEFKTESFTLFEAMLANLREGVTGQLMHIQMSQGDAPPEELEAYELPPMQAHHVNPMTGEDEFALAEAALSSAGTLAPPRPRVEPVKSRGKNGAVDPQDESTWGRVSRNAPCPCGSGKKYKHCHGKHE
ncbi:MAG: preprotein translocase subunit SecA [Hyphomicrobiaceae bacterium]